MGSMIPRIYQWNCTDFKSNGEGLLVESYDWSVKEVLNGVFTATFKYPSNGRLVDYIKRGNFIKTDASKRLKNQKFRIYKVEKDQEDDMSIKVECLHKSFDIARDFMPVQLNLENVTCEYAMNQIFVSSINSKNYIGYSDVENAQNFSIGYVTPGEAIKGKEGSIVDTFGNGTHILRDNSERDTISVLKSRGRNSGVLLSYGKNLTGFKGNEDDTDLITRIIPMATYQLNGETVEYRPKKYTYVDAPNAGDYYGIYYTTEIDFSDKLNEDEVPTDERLKQLCDRYYADNRCNYPKFSFEINFQSLDATTLEMTHIDELYDIGIGDTVLVWHKVYKIRTEAVVSEVDYDPLTGEYNKIKLGDIRSSLGDIIGGSGEPGKDGAPGKDGQDGAPGKDGDLSDFPNTLPTVPVVSLVSGLSTIEISWTMENKIYYTYEVYGSQDANFQPNVFNLIYSGQASAHLLQAEPNQTWYFYVRALNTHGQSTAFSAKKSISTYKITDATTWFEEAAIGDAIIGELRLDRGWVGQLVGHHIDARNLTVTDGNGKKTLNIDSFGRVSIDANSFMIQGNNVAQTGWVNAQITNNANGLLQTVSDNYTDKSQFTQTVKNFEFKFSNANAPNLVPNGNPRRNNNSGWRIEGDNAWFYQHHPEDWCGIASNNSGWETFAFSPDIRLYEGGKYSLSFFLQKESNVESCEVYLIGSEDENYRYDWVHSCTGTIKDNNFRKVKQTIDIPSYIKYVRFRIDHDRNVNPNVGGYVVWFGEFMLIRGENIYPDKWYPANNETFNNISSIDSDGIKIQHTNSNGSYTRVNAQELFQVNEDGNRTLALRYGGLRYYAFPKYGHNTTSYLGSLSSTLFADSGLYGATWFGSSNNGYLSIGFSEMGEDNIHSGINSWLFCNHYDGNGGVPHGIHTYKNLYIRSGSHFMTRPNFNYGIAFPYYDGGGNNSEVSYITTSANQTPGSRELMIIGADRVSLLVQNGGNFTGHRIYEDANSGAKLGHECWGHWNMNGWTINRVNISNTLSDISMPLGSVARNYTRETTAIMSTKNLIQDRGEDYTYQTDGELCEAIIVIPNDIKYSINPYTYDVNIIKYGRGDIWVEERNEDYFVVKSEREIKFTWVLEGEVMERTRYNNYDTTPFTEEVSSPDTIEELTLEPHSKYAAMDDRQIEEEIIRENIMLLKERNELYRLYTK